MNIVVLHVLQMEFKVKDDVVTFTKALPAELLCTICSELMMDARILTRCSHAFCAQCVAVLAVQEAPCPLCRAPKATVESIALPQMANLTRELPIFCGFKAQGCQQEVVFGQKYAHERVCLFGPAHCEWRSRGCQWTGTRVDAQKHATVCPFERLREFIQQNDERISRLDRVVAEQRADIDSLKRFVARNMVVRVERPPRPFAAGETPEEEDTDESDALVEDEAVLKRVSPMPVEPPRLVKSRWAAGLLDVQQTLLGSPSSITALTTSGGAIFSGSHDSKIRMWEMVAADDDDDDMSDPGQEYRCVHVFEGHKLTVWALEACGDSVYSGSTDGVVKRWSVEGRKCVNSAIAHGGLKVYCMTLSNTYLITGARDGSVELRLPNDLALVHTLDAHKECVWSMVVQGDLLYTCSEDKSIRVWDLLSLGNVKELRDERHNSKFLSIAVGQGYICAGTDRCTIDVYTRDTSEFERALTGHSWEVWSLKIDRDMLFSGSFDRSVRIWQLGASFDCLRILSAHKGFLHSLAILSVNLFVSGGSDKAIKVYGLSGDHEQHEE